MKEPNVPTLKAHEIPIRTSDAATRFSPTIGRTMSHDWIDPNVITSSTSKADKSPVPQAMWDKRIELVFPDRTGVMNLITKLRKGLLRVYRRRLLTSFLHYLQTSYDEEYSNYMKGQRLARNGGMLFSMTIILPWSREGKS